MRDTKTDRSSNEWRIKDDVVRLRHWGSDLTYTFPSEPTASVLLGTADACEVQLVDPSGHASREHARLERHREGWLLRDLGSKNGVRFDGAKRTSMLLEPGLEIGIGRLTFIAESRLLIELRSWLARLLGWTADRLKAIDLALRAVKMAATRRVPLVVCAKSDLTQLARTLHQHVKGTHQPFIVCDPRRKDVEANVRSPSNIQTGMAALEQAQGGSLCVVANRLPKDFDEVRVALRDPAVHVQLIVCIDAPRESKPYDVEPIVIPPLETRHAEAPRVIAEFAEDVALELGLHFRLAAADREWIAQRSAKEVADIEMGVRRLLTIRQHGNNATAAAESLGMAASSLRLWFGRRRLPGFAAGAEPAKPAPSRSRR